MRHPSAKSERTLRRRTAPPALAAVVLAAALALCAAPAVPEPYFSVREGYKCSRCHVNKTGGGPRTDYAQVYMHTRMAMDGGAAGGEDGPASDAFHHGRLNETFSVGADVRAMITRSEQDRGRGEWRFGRPDTCQSCHAATDGGGKEAEVYLHAQPLPGVASIVATQNLLPKVATREIYGLLQADWADAYLKAGTFRLPTGLNNTFDAPFVHGDINEGFTGLVGLETVRGKGVEFGIEPGPFAFALSVTNPQTPEDFPNKKRVHLNAYAVGRAGLLGLAYYDDPVRTELERTFTGVYGGVSFGRFTVLAEVDQFTDEDPTAVPVTETEKRAGMAEVDFLITRGHNVKLVLEAFDPDTTRGGDIRDRQSLIYEPFFTPYLQLRVGLRLNNGPVTAQPTPVNAKHYFLELHWLY